MDPIKEKKEAFKGGRGGGGGSSGNIGTSILGNSGLMVHAGGITQCSSTDQTWFCWLSRLVGIIQYVLFILVIIFVLYYFVWPMVSKNLGFSGSRKGKRRG
jgi:hypothetical protein